MIANNNKQQFLIGIYFLIAAFVGIVGVFYGLGHINQNQAGELSQLKDQLTMLEVEKTNTQTELSDVKSRLNTIDLDYLLTKADAVYPTSEKARTEGLLWMDSVASKYVVTLGALNGLKAGSQLGVYEGDRKIGQVVVNTPLDVISYVSPANQSLQLSADNSYRVVIE